MSRGSEERWVEGGSLRTNWPRRLTGGAAAVKGAGRIVSELAHAARAAPVVVRGQPILDLGVGGGRTVPLLRAVSSDYVAVDYTPAMGEACRRRPCGDDLRDVFWFQAVGVEGALACALRVCWCQSSHSLAGTSWISSLR